MRTLSTPSLNCSKLQRTFRKGFPMYARRFRIWLPILGALLTLTCQTINAPTKSNNPNLVPSDTPTLLVPSDTPTLLVPSDTPTPLIPTDTSTTTPSPTSATPMVTPKTDPANCRFGPGTTFSSVGGLATGSIVPIHGTIADQSWWQIESPQDPGTFCWVSAPVTNTFGDLSLVPFVSIPTGLVTTVVVTTPAVVHGVCGGPNPTNFNVIITTNGPVTVLWHFEIHDDNGTLLNSTTDQSMVFAAADSQTYVSDAYKRDCGSYVVKVVTTSPNSITGQASWTVLQP